MANLSYPSYNSAGYLQLPSNTSAGDYTLHVTDAAVTTTIASYLAPLNTLNLSGSAITVLASGFLDPSANSNGAGFGLWVALPSGGTLIPLPLYTSIPTGLADEKNLANQLSFYPNPVAGELWLLNKTEAVVNIAILSLDGKNVYSTTSSAQEININTETMAKGVYILKVSSGQSTYAKKLIRD